MKKFWPRSIFRIFLISYLIILILPAVLAGYLYYEAYSNAQDKYIESGQGRIAKATTAFESYLGQLDSMSVKLVYDTDLKQIVKMTQPEPGESTVIEVVEFSNRVRTMLNSEQNSSYALILKNNEFIFSNTSTNYGLDFFYGKMRVYEDLTVDEVIETTFSAKRRGFMPIQYVTSFGERMRALTYNYSVGSDGVVQYLIPVSYIEDVFDHVLVEEVCELQIYSASGYLGALGTGIPEGIVYDQEQFSSLSGYIESEDSEMVALYAKTSSGLIFVYHMPKSVAFADAYQLGRTSFIAAMMCILLEIALGCFFAWKYSTPLKNMLNSVSSVTGSSSTPRDEYRALENGVQELIENHQQVLKDREERQKRSIINQILNGWLRNEENVRQSAEEAGIPLGTGPYCIILCRAEEDVMRQKVSGLQGSKMRWVYDMEDGTYAMLAEVGKTQELEGWLCSEPVLPTGVGKVYSSLQDLVFSYQQAQHVLDSSLVFYEEMPQENREAYYPDDLEERLMQSTKHGELESIEEIFRILIKENAQKRTLSRMMIRILQADLASTYMKVRKDIVFDPEWTDPEELFVKDIPLETMLQAYAQEFSQLGRNVHQAQKDKKEEVREGLIRYLEENYSDQQLCVAQMSEVFGFSESYFSQFFKDATGESFSTCLERIRMEHAKALLLDPEKDVETITQLTGYTNSTSFRRAFKRFTGISPSVWRQENV